MQSDFKSRNSRKSSDANLIVRPYRKDDKFAIKSICKRHFRSLTPFAVRYYLLENSRDFFVLLSICKIFVLWKQLFLVIAIYIVYLFIRAYWEIEYYILKECHDLEQIEDYYMEKERSHFWVAEYSYRCFPCSPTKNDDSVNLQNNSAERSEEDTQRLEGEVQLQWAEEKSYMQPEEEANTQQPEEEANTQQPEEEANTQQPEEEANTQQPEEEANFQRSQELEEATSGSLLKSIIAKQSLLDATEENAKEVASCSSSCTASTDEDHCVIKKIVGCVGCAPSRENPKIAQLVRLVVAEEARRMRIGSRLLLQFEQFAEANNFDEIRLYTNDLNTNHFKFIRQHGYTIIQWIPRSLMRGSLVHWKKDLKRKGLSPSYFHVIDDVECNKFD